MNFGKAKKKIKKEDNYKPENQKNYERMSQYY